jgi:hypothetical protein
MWRDVAFLLINRQHLLDASRDIDVDAKAAIICAVHMHVGSTSAV